MNRYRDIVGHINWWLFLVVVALLPFPQLPLRYACVAWIICWALEGRWLHKSNFKFQISNFKFSIPFLLFGLWYAWKALSYFWSSDPAAWAWEMERYMTFGLMVPVGIWGVNAYYDWRKIGKVLIVSCVAAIPVYISLVTALFYHPQWITALQLQDVWDYSQTQWLPSLVENISVFKHRLFLCSVELFGMIMACRLYKKRLGVLIPLLCVMGSSLIITGSRQSMLTLIALAGIGLLYLIPRAHRKGYAIGLLVAGVLIGGTVLKLHPRTQFYDIHVLSSIRAVDHDGREPRLNIWGLALQHPEEYSAYGLGAGQSLNYLVTQYESVGYYDYAQQRFTAHNQYLEEWMEIGIPGLLFFLLAWLTIPLCAWDIGRRTAWQFTALFILNMCTECMFGRFCGIALWAVGMVIILLQSDAEREEQSAGDTQAH